MLVTNNKSGLYNGVNQQSPEHRIETQVEECINAYPTVNSGLLKRNPTQTLVLSDDVSYDEDMYVYEYDRGLSSGVEEKYSLQITNEQMQIIDVQTGSVKTKLNGGIVFSSDSAESYLSGVVSPNAYSAITLKDTTFIVNKNKTVTMKDYSTEVAVENENTQDNYYANILLGSNIGADGFNYSPVRVYSKIWFGPNAGLLEYTNSTLTISADGTSVNISANNIIGSHPQNISMSQYKEYCRTVLQDRFDSSIYTVSLLVGNTGIQILKNDGTTISGVSASISFEPFPKNANILANPTSASLGLGTSTGITSGYASNTTSYALYGREAYIWVRSSNPSSAYSYTVSIDFIDNLGVLTTIAKTTSNTTTEAAASALATAFNGTVFDGYAEGSIVRLVLPEGYDIVSVNPSDSYGNQAMEAWGKTFASHLDLPKSMPFDSTVNITGTNDTDFGGYWLKSSNGIWVETMSPSANTEIDSSTMPHIMVRNFNEDGEPYFTISEYSGWDNMKVGDEDTNKIPSFIGEKIKDIFFFKNRLGFITPYSVIFSEVANYGNFWRTTVSTLLESDRIDTNVDTSKAIELEYAVYIEDSLILFSDKAQFKLEGQKVLSPSSVQISQTSAYEINKSVRPIFLNDKVFFCATRGNYTAVMQYYISDNGRLSEAIDITAHVDKYITSDVTRLSGSSINNLILITTKTDKDTIFGYKYLDSGNQRVQSAWFKWTYNADIYNMFSLGRNLNIMLKRYQNSVVSDWVLGNGVWNSSKLWTSNGVWVGSPDSLTSQNSFEIQPIHPQEHDGYFVDASEFVEDINNVENVVRTSATGVATLSCSVAGLNDIIIKSLTLDNSVCPMSVTTSTGAIYSSTTNTLIVPKFAAQRILTISANPLTNSSFLGFSVVYSNDVDSEIVYNSQFSNSLTNWTLIEDWTINYGTKDLGSIIPVSVELGEWVLMSGGKANLSGSLKMKTCQISSQDGSDFSLRVHNLQRKNDRIIKGKYTVNRKPMIYGDSKNMRVSIENSSDTGFKINSVTFEGNFNSRSKRS